MYRTPSVAYRQRRFRLPPRPRHRTHIGVVERMLEQTRQYARSCDLFAWARQPGSPGATRPLTPGSAAYGSPRRATTATRLPAVGAPVAAITMGATSGTRTRDRFALRRITGGRPFAGIGTPGPRAGGTGVLRLNGGRLRQPRSLGMARGPLAAHPGHSGPRLVLPDKKTTKYRCRAALRPGCRLGEGLDSHDHQKPDRGDPAGNVLGGYSGRGTLPERRAHA